MVTMRMHSSRRSGVILLGLVYLLTILLVVLIYFVLRLQHPGAWNWGIRLMNGPLAAAGAGLLVVASLASTAAAWGMRKQRRGLAVIGTLVAASAALGFGGTVLSDYSVKWSYGIRPGEGFHPNRRYLAHCS